MTQPPLGLGLPFPLPGGLLDQPGGYNFAAELQKARIQQASGFLLSSQKAARQLQQAHDRQLKHHRQGRLVAYFSRILQVNDRHFVSGLLGDHRGPPPKYVAPEDLEFTASRQLEGPAAAVGTAPYSPRKKSSAVSPSDRNKGHYPVTGIPSNKFDIDRKMNSFQVKLEIKENLVSECFDLPELDNFFRAL